MTVLQAIIVRVRTVVYKEIDARSPNLAHVGKLCLSSPRLIA